MSASKPPLAPASAPDLEILGDQVTVHPAGYFAESQGGQDDSPERNLVEHMARFRQSPLDFLREVSLHLSGSGWRAYDDFIGQPIFYPGFTENMKAAVMSVPMLQRKIAELAETRLQVEEAQGLLSRDDGLYFSKREKRLAEIEDSLRQVAEDLTSGMICKFESKTFIRGAYYLCTQLLTRAYHQGIHVSSAEVVRLRSVAEEAAKKKHSIIFLPCHRSHVDYVSLQLICYRLGIALPTVVAGDNLNFPVVGQFLQNAGAMWIRRSFGDDVLYTTLVQSYIDTLLQNGYNFECFIEGGRSRTGKLLSPKFGILSFLLDSVLSGRVDDAIICPVSTQYDKVIETESYVSELLGQPKAKENLLDFLSASSVLSLKLGRVDVRFHEPWSLKGFIADQQARFERIPQPADLRDSKGSGVKVRLLRTLGYKVLSDINDVSVVMPTALIGTVLLTLRGRGVGKAELVRRVDWLCDRVRAKGGRVAHFAGTPTSVVVDRALEVLGPGLVGRVEGLLEETFYAVDRFQLSFYRNMTIHLFISEALVSAAMYTRVKLGGGPDNQAISYTSLFNQVSFLSQLFRGEFIFPTEGLAVNLDKTLRGLENDNVIRVRRNSAGTIDQVELSDAERQCGRENLDFYCFLIWPFIEASWLGAVSLMGLTPPLGQEQDMWCGMKQTQDKAQLLGKTLYHQGDLSYFEAVNKETLKNAYQRFEEEAIITASKSKESRAAPTVKLAAEWIPRRDSTTGKIIPEGRLWDFTETIAQSRREGKNRRDGATVSTRVLALADKLGQELFRTAATSPHPSSGGSDISLRKRRFGVILDAGSSGTRVHIYRWLDNVRARKEGNAKELQSLPILKTKKRWTKKIHPGISTFADKPDLVGPDHLEPLFRHALDNVPPDAVANTPIFLLATAGMRLLPELKRKELLANICSYARAHTDFLLPECNLHIQVIPGETEGLYGWIAANYLLGGFDSPQDHAHGKGHHTYGFLDMGGASAQIAFAPNATEAEKHAEDLKLLRMRTVNGLPMEYRVFVTTWLGFGVHEARRRYVEALLDASGTHDARELPDPCLPVGLSITTKGDVLLPGSGRVNGKTPYLIGTGRFDECLRQTYPLLDKHAPCENQPCLLNGVHVPAIDFDVNHFVGVSEYWHTTHEVFETVYKDKAYDFNTYQKRVKDFCSQDWKTISKGVDDSKWGKKVDEATAVEVCFKASWLINVLHDGIGIPRVGLENTKTKGYNGTKEVLQHAKEKGFLDPFQAVDKIEDTEVSWTLGKMLLYAASQVQPRDSSLPVGFGSNVPGIPPDFQYAGSKYAPAPNVSSSADDDHGDDWHDTLFDSTPSRRVPGFLIFMIIVCIAVFLLCGRDRRTRIYRRLISPFHPNRNRFGATNRKRKLFHGKLPFFTTHSGPVYERVLEDGSASASSSALHAFELAAVDADHSDENDHSDSSEGSRAGRTSGWATPRVKINGFEKGHSGYLDNVVSQGVGLGLTVPGMSSNAMDRSGLVVRTESRERLGPSGSGSGVTGAVGGRRSRTGSPVRFKSPLMKPLAED